MADSAAVSRVSGPRTLDRSSVLPQGRWCGATALDGLEGPGSVDGQAGHGHAPTLRVTQHTARAALSALRPRGASTLKSAALRLTASLQRLSGDSIAIILAVGLVLGTFP